ncbi:hypothetical protein ACXYTJ_10340 [Gilvimarinus sp. F26214L]|uniref:hypothetical protein n=1 Tax=Gilvimarinus sp. DZF01 TaxID=3461371 RepID=UPI0040459D98
MRIVGRTFLGLVLLVGFVVQGSAEEGIDISEESFTCLAEMTPVRGFFVDNLLGDVEATVEVAESPTGGRYPAGSVVQLVPTEVMVKQPEGTSPATGDWEFFELTVSAGGSQIAKRGFEDVVNRFGGKCLDCHAKAEPQWDMVCEKGHGCDPLPFTPAMVRAIQKTDPRCAEKPALSDVEKQALAALQRSLGAGN